MAPTLCTVQDVLDRCGKNANATIIASSSIVERYIATSENFICQQTRRDWIQDSGSLTAELKGMLKLCASTHAANAIIMYDMSGYTSRFESTTMLDVNYDDFTKSLKALQDQDVKLRKVND